MAKSNRERVGAVMDALKEGLGPFVLREFHATYGGIFLEEIRQTLKTEAYAPPPIEDVATALQSIDTQGWLNLMWRRWNEVFKNKLDHAHRSYVSELMNARNSWAHQTAFTNDQAYRVADTAALLLSAVGASKEAQTVQDIGHELLRLRYEAQQKASQKAAASQSETLTTTSPGLRPWRLVVKPHPDVSSGRYVQAEFAADLSQVVQGKADPEYGDPQEFFRRTYLTEGLRDLLVTGIKRLTGQGGDPVVQLQTSFGGGKTHSMLALYHLFGGKIGFSEIPGGENIVQRIGNIDDHIEARRAVIVGTAFSPTEPRRYRDCTTYTLWGDIAYQIGGVEAYRIVETADTSGVSPGSDTLLQLLETYGPALLIVDELVAFARNLYGVSERLPAGSFDAVMTFFQSLTEAVKRSSDSMLLVSIPESNIEIGGEGGRAALEILAKTIGRIESVWKPVTATESFEIVRRRLFSSEIDYAARDAVLSAFRQMYMSTSSEFPREVSESDYFRQMKEAYPIHPELFKRLYEDWSTLDRFQRTRGVLRLMAAVIHCLWQNNDQSLMIMPASIPLWNAAVRNEMLRYLPENWPAIVDTDVDGESSKPYQLDKSTPDLGQYEASRRVARAIFVGSAPSVAGQSVRGVEEVRVRLATAQPGEKLPVFSDALRRMTSQLTYLYNDGSRYWYDTRPTVNRIAQDRAQNIHPDEVYAEAVRRLRAERFRREDFAAAHVAPQSSADIADEWRTRVVVLGLEHAHARHESPSKAQSAAKEMLEHCGSSLRLYRNVLVFIAPDANNAVHWEKSLRDYLAWKSINDEAEPLNLDAQQRKQVTAALKAADETLLNRMQETYCWLIVPAQPEPTIPIVYEAYRISGQGAGFYERAAQKLRDDELIIYRWSPDNLQEALDHYSLWRDQPHVSLKQLWEYFARYCYLPRLFSEQVLMQTIHNGVARVDAPFGCAAAANPDGTYSRLTLGASPNFSFDDNTVIVQAEVARAQMDVLRQAHPPVQTASSTLSVSAQVMPDTFEPPQPKPKTRYHGTVSLDPQRVNREMQTITDEIIQHLTSLVGTQVSITVEISAEHPSGFSDAAIRTINENSRTLKFKSYGFEE